MHTGFHAQYLFEHLDRIRLARVDLHRLPNDAIAAASDDLYEMKVVGSDLLRFGGGAGRRRRRPAVGVLLHAVVRGAVAMFWRRREARAADGGHRVGRRALSSVGAPP